MTPSRKILSCIAAFAAIAAVGACSSSGDSSPRSSGAAIPAAPKSSATGSPIKVGVVCSCSGVYGTQAAVAGKVAQAWSKAVNAAGGISGHPIDLILKDDASNPGTSVTAAQSLISEKVATIFDISLFDTTWEKAVTDAKIPVVGGAFNAPPFSQNPDFYPAGQTYDSIVTSDILTAKAAGATNMGQLNCAESQQCQEAGAARKALGKKLGVPVIYSTEVSSTAPNYTAQCLAAKQAGVQALEVGASPTVMVHVAQDCERQGYHPIYVEEGTGFGMQLAAAPGFKDRLWANFPILPFFADNPAVARMNSAVDKYYPGLRADKVTWTEYAAQAWAGGLLIEKAVQNATRKASDQVGAAELTKGLDSIKNETLDGLSPPLTFTAGKPHTVDCWYTARLQNGKPTLANGGKVTCKRGTSS